MWSELLSLKFEDEAATLMWQEPFLKQLQMRINSVFFIHSFRLSIDTLCFGCILMCYFQDMNGSKDLHQFFLQLSDEQKIRLMCPPYMDEAKNTKVEELVSKEAFEAIENLCRVCIL